MKENDAVNDFLFQIALIVKDERRKRNISQLKLANILGHSSPNYVAKIEKGRKGANYNLKHLYLIARAFSMSVCDLLPSSSSTDGNDANG
jgi:transcriptional regulator with XRE-family HTH domain